MSKQVESAINAAFDRAERARRCYVPTCRSEIAAIRRRAEAFVEPLREMFLRRPLWQSLTPPQRTLYLARSLMTRHPNWRLCEASAAVAYDLPVTWSQLANIHVDVPPGASDKSGPGIVRHHLNEATQMHKGLPLVPFWRTVFDCMATFGFADALAIGDSAAQKAQVSAKQICEFFRSEFRGRRGVRRALRAATLVDARAESGGESIARATMRQLGFARPELQVWIRDPIEPDKWFRVDFLWITKDGRIIIGELDGRQKTSQEQFRGGRSALRVLQDERLRESHLTALHPAIVRFSYDDAADPERLGPLLELFGVPREPESWPTEPPDHVAKSAELVITDGRPHVLVDCRPA